MVLDYTECYGNGDTLLLLWDETGGRPCWSKGKKMSTDAVYKNMLAHLQWDIELEWLQRFDIDKLKILNKMLSRKRDSDTDKYMAFVEKFYDSKCFNDSYDLYIKHDRNSWFRPYNPSKQGWNL